MSFWSTQDGVATDTGTEFEVGGNMEPIPGGSCLKSMITGAEWKRFEDDPEFINLEWTVLEPSEYKNRKIFQKLRVNNEDNNKRDKALRMLAAIDANAGGQLAKTGDTPTDQDLQAALLNKIMMIDVQVWTITAEQSNDGLERSGNWVNKVGGTGQPQAAEKKPDVDDDIPF